MGKIIQFKTREEIDRENKRKVLDDWNAYLEWEQETMNQLQKDKVSK